MRSPTVFSTGGAAPRLGSRRNRRGIWVAREQNGDFSRSLPEPHPRVQVRAVQEWPSSRNQRRGVARDGIRCSRSFADRRHELRQLIHRPQLRTGDEIQCAPAASFNLENEIASFPAFRPQKVAIKPCSAPKLTPAQWLGRFFTADCLVLWRPVLTWIAAWQRRCASPEASVKPMFPV